ncbi:MAG: 50S ribosomal protein L11 methyltransferase [Ilumatobacteraceae bacterium]
MRMIAVRVPAAEAELAADRLWTAGARAVEVRPAPADTVDLITMLASDDGISVERIGPVLSRWSVRFVDVDDRPAETWREFVRPIDVDGVLVIRPAWLSAVDDGRLEIAIEPGGSFGLGDHPTTRLAASAAHRLTVPGDRVLDVGCGSGVLAIIAAARGAGHVRAVDIADAAADATAENARSNGVAHLVQVDTTTVDLLDGPYDLVLANILAPVLVALAADLRRLTAPGGRLVVSGVLTDRHQHVTEALAPMMVRNVEDLDGWAAIELTQP